MSDHDRAGEFGPIYLPALRRIRDLWLELEPLVDATSYDDVIAPTELQIRLTDGLGDADAARLDIQWSELGMYSFHYVDGTDVNWRFDRHPNTHSPEIHFHPPPDAATTAAEPSCIDVTEVSLVTRAVHAMWRTADEDDDIDHLNRIRQPGHPRQRLDSSPVPVGVSAKSGRTTGVEGLISEPPPPGAFVSNPERTKRIPDSLS